MNILFLSVGRRVELIQQFRNAAKSLRYKLIIFGADFSETAPALFFCDKVHKTPKISDSKYIDDLLSYCSQEKIDLVIPTIDTDLLILSQSKELFANIGTKVLISNPEVIEICRNKLLTQNFFKSIGLFTPDLCLKSSDYNMKFPAFIRPINGSSSIDAFKIFNKEELEMFSSRIVNYIIAPFISGQEYTVDCFCDFDGNPIFITPRIRLAIRSGEVLKTKISYDSKIVDECKKIIHSLKPCGPVTIQLIKEDLTNNDYYIEINARFGGGAPLSMKAGADSTKALLELLNNKKCNYIDKAADDNALFCRFDQSVRLK